MILLLDVKNVKRRLTQKKHMKHINANHLFMDVVFVERIYQLEVLTTNISELCITKFHPSLLSGERLTHLSLLSGERLTSSLSGEKLTQRCGITLVTEGGCLQGSLLEQ